MPDEKPECDYKEYDLPVATEEVSVRRAPDGQYVARWQDHSALVRVFCCFPWSEPGRYISLRDDKDREVVLIKQLGDLDVASREAVERGLAETGFVLEIIRVDDLREEFEIRAWKVMTRQGPRRFQTRRDEWPQKVARGGLLVRDVAGDLYHIADPHALDAASRKRLAVYID